MSSVPEEELSVKEKIALFSKKNSKPLAPSTANQSTNQARQNSSPSNNEKLIPVNSSAIASNSPRNHSYNPSYGMFNSKNGVDSSPLPTRYIPSPIPVAPPIVRNPSPVAVPLPPPIVKAPESETKRSQLGDGVILWTETFKGPPTKYQYTIESDIFRKITFTFKFDGSENFELDASCKIPGIKIVNRLEAIIEINPYKKSPVVTCRQVDINKGGSLRMSMSWVLSSPDVDILQKYADEYESKIVEILSIAGETFSEVKDSSDISSIEKVCKEKDTNFIDVNFPPHKESLYKMDPNIIIDEVKFSEEVSKRRPIVWRRPSEYKSTTSTENSIISPKDIKQGYLSNYYFSCALTAIVEQPVLLQKIFPDINVLSTNSDSKLKKNGVYEVKLCVGGSWQVVLVDDYIPCVPEGGPCYTRCSNSNDLWVQLVEKAYAKIFGSYRSIKVGWFADAISDLTGFPTKELRFADSKIIDDIASGQFWELLNEWQKSKYLLSLASNASSASVKSNNQIIKLRPAHSYSILSLALTSDGDKIFEIRCPWGPIEWTGDYSNTSPLLTEELKAQIAYDEKKDSFWMNLRDIQTYFSGICVSMSKQSEVNGAEWFEKRLSFDYKFSKTRIAIDSVPLYKLTLEESVHASELYISVHQKDKRIVGAKKYIDCGVTLLQQDADGAYQFVASCGNGISRQSQLDMKSLPSGTYYVVPTSVCCKIEQYKSSNKEVVIEGDSINVSSVLTIHCSNQFIIEDIPFDSILLNKAIELTILKEGSISDLFGDDSVTLFTYKSPGNMGISYAAKNNREVGAVCFTLDVSDSDNIISDKGNLVVDCPIAPGQFRVMLHVAPADDASSWTCGLFCKATTISDAALEEALKKENEFV